MSSNQISATVGGTIRSTASTDVASIASLLTLFITVASYNALFLIFVYPRVVFFSLDPVAGAEMRASRNDYPYLDGKCATRVDTGRCFKC